MIIIIIIIIIIMITNILVIISSVHIAPDKPARIGRLGRARGLARPRPAQDSAARDGLGGRGQGLEGRAGQDQVQFRVVLHEARQDRESACRRDRGRKEDAQTAGERGQRTVHDGCPQVQLRVIRGSPEALAYLSVLIFVSVCLVVLACISVCLFGCFPFLFWHCCVCR